MNKRVTAKKAKQQAPAGDGNGIGQQLSDLAKKMPAIHHAVEEVAEDNVALMQAVKRTAEGQDALRALLVQEMEQLRSDVAGALSADALRACCRELAPVVSALEAMSAGADFSDGGTIRQHVESLAMTMGRALGRLGIDRIPVEVGSEIFDSRLHECVRVCTQADSPMPEAASRTIVRVQEAGYLVRGRVVTPAKVWVQKNEAEAEKEAKA